MILISKNKIIGEILRDLSKKYYASELAKKLNLDQKTTANILYKLEKEKYLKSLIQGRNRLFYLNFNELTKLKLFLYLEEIKKKEFFIEKNLILKELVLSLDNVFKDYLIFGSYAKNLEKPNSDLDIFTIKKYKQNDLNKISKTFNIKIQVFYINKREFKKQLKNHNIFIKEIIKDHIIMEGYEYFINNFIKLYYRK